MEQSIIPILDYSLLFGKSRKHFVDHFHKANIEFGFSLIKNHPIDLKLLEEVVALEKQFFSLPSEIKMKYHFAETGGQKGYTPVGVEKAQGAKTPDNKEFCQFGDMFPCPFIEEIPLFQEKATELFKQFNAMYKELLRATEEALNTIPGFLVDTIGNSIMRQLHYPASFNQPVVGDEVIDGGDALHQCAYAHKDINTFTLLHALEPGLKLQHKQTMEWIPILCTGEYIIVNTGLMLEHVTGGLYKAGVHKVECEPGVDRSSRPFFGHRVDEASIKPLTNLGFVPDYEKYPFETEGPYLQYVLRAIGLIK